MGLLDRDQVCDVNDRRERSDRHMFELIETSSEPPLAWHTPTPEREPKTSTALRLVVLILALAAAIAFYFSRSAS